MSAEAYANQCLYAAINSGNATPADREDQQESLDRRYDAEDQRADDACCDVEDDT